MKLKIVDHAKLAIPSVLITKSEHSKNLDHKSGKSVVPRAIQKTCDIAKRSSGIFFGAGTIAIVSFNPVTYPGFFIASLGTWAVTCLVMLPGLQKNDIRAYFPGRSKTMDSLPEPDPVKLCEPYKNWDEAFLPYTKDMVNIAYPSKAESEKAMLLGGLTMENFGKRMSNRSEEDAVELKSLYGEVAQGDFWTESNYLAAVRYRSL